MTQKDFFEKIRSECSSNKEYILELLKLRGFLFEEKTNGLILSDNSHHSDAKYLDELLRRYNMGRLIQNEVVLSDGDCNEFINIEFREYNQIAAPSCWQARDWSWFKRIEYGRKAPVSCLEPYIARYIKAISACGVFTVGSCDGNHPKCSKMIIMTEGEGSIPWHKLLCEKLLVDRFNINWTDDCAAMSFTDETKYATYYEVNKAAELLYMNRKEIRSVRSTALSGMTQSYFRNHTSEEIEKEFIGRAAELIDGIELDEITTPDDIAIN